MLKVSKILFKSGRVTACWTHEFKPLLIKLLIGSECQYDAYEHGKMKDLVALTDEIETACGAPLLRDAHDVAEHTDCIAVNRMFEVA